MKVIAINSSPRPAGNTAQALGLVCQALAEQGVPSELVQLAPLGLRGCRACMRCFETKDRRCHGVEDQLNGLIEKLLAAQGMLLGTPVYFAGLSADLKALIERVGMVARANNDMFRRKVGAAVVAVRRQGALPAFDGINHFFLISQMIVPGSSYWNMVLGGKAGELMGDNEGVQTMRTLGENMAWLLHRLAD